ncbi:MAG: bifunctional diaminohydroxyphosphoribosylaminopyrimidine deaminase/5-amino-6-(5-phosphoribosylamino)uracil reductase RibD [Candidatus Omnitrophica bacterium]|nr:bifunctional diaminohydroxyphosphoribosylaminopyrimidine deaminase/5-amino-6-(5-phosphoribosylamino)uracil reductase RibD [Candidatus Omnitrophota bacterium]
MPRDDKKFMQLALRLAGKAKDATYPNPMVGAVIVKRGVVIGKGYHKKAGMPHAEVEAIKNAELSRHNCRGAEMFVTLEPCDHYGKTPPCTKAIISAGIGKVYAAMLDPNPMVSGKGAATLRKNGIKVELGLCREEAGRLNRKYIKYITTGLPYVTIKLAESLDGKIAASDASSKWITGENSRTFVKKMRSRYNAVVVGADTAINDDPSLLGVRSLKTNFYRVVVDTTLRVNAAAKLFQTAEVCPVIIFTTDLANKSKIIKLKKIAGAEIVVLKNERGRVPLRAALKYLGAKGAVNVLVEGGGRLAGALFDESLVDEWMFFISPKIIGGDKYLAVRGKGSESIDRAVKLKNVKYRKFEEDILVTGETCSRD